MNKQNKLQKALLWIIVVLVSAIIIIVGSKKTTKNIDFFKYDANVTEHAVVTSVGKKTIHERSQGTDVTTNDYEIAFKCKILSGKHKDEIVNALQTKSSNYALTAKVKIVENGDRVLLTDSGGWQFVDYYRLDKIGILAIIFAIGLIIIGLKKGINALISLTFTALFVFCVFLPWIMNGYNIYLGILLTCTFTIVMTLLLIEGATKKSLVTMLGCFAGTGMAALVTYISNIFLHLTGMTDEHSIYITMLFPDKPIDLVALVFSGIIIGALGAIMDVAMDISSSLNEIVIHVPDIKFTELFRSGMRIGMDIMGTMSNTLILAYIGSSVTDIMLLITYSSSIVELANREVIIADMLQALAGSMAILLTVPFTVVLAGIVYLGKRRIKKA